MAGSFNGVAVPADGKTIGYSNGKYSVPDNPIIPYIEGDGTGRDIWKASQRVFDAAVEKAYWRQAAHCLVRGVCGRKGHWRSSANGCPQGTLDAIKEFRIAIKGPLTTPVGGGIRRLNVALRQIAESLRLLAPGEVLPGRALAGAAPRADEHHHLPREHRRRLRRHRVARGNAAGEALIEFVNKPC